ncbi:hypothetical protein ABZ235_26675 [Streptomyces canus]|uniref:hypothetical protein n=1 Tax=Streptomyces canus TaxID=58343 RepID=UPI0033B9DBB7
MELTSALALRQEIFEALRAGKLESSKERMACAYAAASPAHKTPALGGVGLGITARGPGRFALLLLLQVNTDEAHAVAEDVKKRTHGETRIEYVGHIRAQAMHMGAVTPTLPLRPGMSIGHPAITAGTLGAFVTRGDQSGVYVLSNNHVLANCGNCIAGLDEVLQPGPDDGGVTTVSRIGAVADVVPLGHIAGDVSIDAALGLLDEDKAAQCSWGPLQGLRDPVHLTGEAIGMEDIRVAMYGRTTKTSEGRVIGVETSTDIEYLQEGTKRVETFVNQLVVEGDGGEPFSRAGDSGSLVYRPDSMEPVGLVVAGNDKYQGRDISVTFVTPVVPVLTELGAALLP